MVVIMWILKSAKGEEYILLTNKEHIVSRKESGNLVLGNDDSISRTHAKIKVSHNIKNLNDPTELPAVILVDCGSKYGTFLQDNVKLAANTEVALKDGSVIKFGVQWNVWTGIYKKNCLMDLEITGEAQGLCKAQFERHCPKLPLRPQATSLWSEYTINVKLKPLLRARPSVQLNSSNNKCPTYTQSLAGSRNLPSNGKKFVHPRANNSTDHMHIRIGSCATGCDCINFELGREEVNESDCGSSRRSCCAPLARLLHSCHHEASHIDYQGKINRLKLNVVCALALGCPIVTPKFWDNYLSSVSSKTTLPDYLDFIPPLAEVSLNNSNCFIADDNNLTLGEMIQPHVIVMSYPFDRKTQETQVSTSFKKIQCEYTFLQLKGRRLIPESEIGLAILKCSLDAFCNPTFKSDTQQSTQSTQSPFTSHISGKTLLHSNASSSSKTSSLQTLKTTQSLTFDDVKSSDEALLLQESNILPSSLCKVESTLDSENSCPIRLGRRRTRAAVIVDETSSELTDTLSMEADSNTLHNSDKLTTNILPDVKRRKVEVSNSDILVPDTRKRSRSPEEMKHSPKRLTPNPPLFETKINDAPFTSKNDIPSKVVLNKAHHSKIINCEQSDQSEKYDFSFREDQPKKSAGNPLSTVKRVSLININRCDDFEDDDDNMFNFVGEPRKTSAKKSNSVKKKGNFKHC
uniref:(California timema) hypothetical protein n=1 Tax=Timema californicum TaxID=61474 RepID=A0A7R9JC28_TIMCA|nr:unnamed protein product [Timema californicum]